MSILVRETREDELLAWLELHQYLHSADDPVPDVDVLMRVWCEMLDDPKLHCLVVEMDDKLVAACVLVVIPNLTRGARPYGLIENVVTHTDYRRRGLATQLLHSALDMAWSQQCYKVMLLTGRKDEGVFRFYEGAGFKRDVKTGFIAYPPEPA
ncbi:MAG: GNAT family N-acetyltransferase [Anaerolineae bacterium]|nr:GNAT family N-acetyltransferase [Anaerolineae bacterium]